MEPLVDRAGERVVRADRRAAARVASRSPRASRARPASSGVSPSSIAAARDLPSPRVGDEAVPPEQQHAARRVVDDVAGRLVRDPQDVVLEPGAVRELDVDEPELIHSLS